jgi:outer membrane protein TolC
MKRVVLTGPLILTFSPPGRRNHLSLWERVRVRVTTLLKPLIAFAGLWCASVSEAITLDALLQRTVANNPEIQKAKCDLEKAAGRRLIFHSVALPDATIGVVGGLQGGHRSGEKRNQPFGFGYGGFTQPFFNMAVPPSWRRGNIEVLIAQQQLNVAVTQQLHAARVAFYTAIYNRAVKTLREAQRRRLEENVGSQKSRYESGLTDRGAFVAAEVQTRELDPRIDTAQRAYEGAVLKLSEAIGKDFGQYATLPAPEGELHYTDVDVDLARASAAALENRPDLKLARLLVRAATEDQRIIEAAYYPQITATVSGTYIPISGVRQDQAQGSPRRSDDIISSEIRAGGAYTWRVVDNGKVGGAVAQKRAAREINELLLQKMERDLPRDLSRIENDLHGVATKQKALQTASSAAEQNAATLRQNLDAGIVSQLEYRLGQNDLLDVQTALLSLAYKQNLDLAEWDRATGKYLQFLDDTARNVR